MNNKKLEDERDQLLEVVVDIAEAAHLTGEDARDFQSWCQQVLLELGYLREGDTL